MGCATNSQHFVRHDIRYKQEAICQTYELISKRQMSMYKTNFHKDLLNSLES